MQEVDRSIHIDTGRGTSKLVRLLLQLLLSASELQYSRHVLPLKT